MPFGADSECGGTEFLIRAGGGDIPADQASRVYYSMVLDRKPVPVMPQPRRVHQGWRYFETKDAPPDLTGRNRKGAPPPEMAVALKELGLL